MLIAIHQPPPPPPEILWYDTRRSLSAGGVHARPSDEEMMKVPKALAALSLGLAGFACAGCHSVGSAPTRQVENVRPVEPRLNEDAYRPCPMAGASEGLIPSAICKSSSGTRPKRPPPARSGAAQRGGGTDDSTDVEAAVTRLGDLLRDGDIQGLNRTVRGLERAGETEPHAAGRWSDLAAAYLVRAQRTDDPRDLLRAYDAADRAVQEDESLPAARFNRALATERLFLPEAIGAWRDYLSLDGTSGWAVEAQNHLKALERPSPGSEWEQHRKRLEATAIAGDSKAVEAIVYQNRQAAREHAEQELFGQWADAVVHGQSQLAEDRLRLLHDLGDALAKVEGDSLIHDSVAAIDAVSAAGDLVRWRALVRAHRAFRDGYHAERARNCSEAVEKLSMAREALTEAGSPLALRAEFLLVCCDYLVAKYPHGLDEARKLVQELQGRPYGGLRAHALQVKATLEDSLGKTPEAAQDYAMELAEFRKLGEEENVANAGGLVGKTWSFLGREQQAWQFIYQALQTLPDLRAPSTRANLLMVAGEAALRGGEDAVALAFARARATDGLRADPLAAIEGLTGLAQMQARQGDRQGALASLEEARVRARRLGDREAQAQQQAELAMIEGEMLVQDDPHRAVDLLTPVLAVYRKEKNFLFSLQALLARGRAQRRLGNRDEAERDLSAALALYDDLGSRVEGEDFRLPLLEETEQLFDEMVSLQADRPDPDLAFAYADRARTRVLPGTSSALWIDGAAGDGSPLPAEPQPLPLEEIRRRLPAGITLVQYSVLPEKVLIWVLRHDGKQPLFLSRTITRHDLEVRAARLQDFETGSWGPAAENLFDQLVRPWLDTVPPEERIVFVPDKVLHRVPFAVLKDHGTKQLLIEGHPLVVAPSATLYVRALERQRADRKTGRSHGLVIGNAVVDRAFFSDLPSLEESEKEAQHVAEMTGARLLAGAAATKLAFLTQAPLADWVHFSGHALIDPRQPLSSKLVLTPEGEGDLGVLTAQEIYSLKLDRTRLVILAACDTGNEYIPGSEGATSLARAFLAAGVPTVVASLWSVDDRATSVLFDAFHQALAGNDAPDAVDALRTAQLKMLRGANLDDRSPRAWAGFEVIGASAQ
jgi:CHAT domain-containing protein/tetratricopeptide (TPR) repeat protein